MTLSCCFVEVAGSGPPLSEVEDVTAAQDVDHLPASEGMTSIPVHRRTRSMPEPSDNALLLSASVPTPAPPQTPDKVIVTP